MAFWDKLKFKKDPRKKMETKPKRKPDQDRRTGPGTGISLHDAADAIRERKRKMKNQLDQL